MVTYRIESREADLPERWFVIAMFGNQLEWEVGRYRNRQQAEDRLLRMQEVGKAVSLTE